MFGPVVRFGPRPRPLARRGGTFERRPSRAFGRTDRFGVRPRAVVRLRSRLPDKANERLPTWPALDDDEASFLERSETARRRCSVASVPPRDGGERELHLIAATQPDAVPKLQRNTHGGSTEPPSPCHPRERDRTFDEWERRSSPRERRRARARDQGTDCEACGAGRSCHLASRDHEERERVCARARVPVHPYSGRRDAPLRTHSRVP